MTSTQRASDDATRTTAGTEGLLSRLARGRQGILFICILMAGSAFSVTNDTFLTAQNLLNIGVQSSMILLVAFGMTVVIISGGIDLSVGSMAALAGVFAVWLITSTQLPTNRTKGSTTLDRTRVTTTGPDIPITGISWTRTGTVRSTIRDRATPTAGAGPEWPSIRPT